MESRKGGKKCNKLENKIKAVKSKTIPLSRNAEFEISIMKQINFHTRDKIQGWKKTCQVNKNQKITWNSHLNQTQLNF